VSWSLGETGALALKAARGAGMPWGLAEEASEAVSWLQARNLPGVSALCRYLNWYQLQKPLFPKWTGIQIEDNTIPYCPFVVGTAISDGAIKMSPDVNTKVSLGFIRQPLLLLPFVSSSAPEDYGLYVEDSFISNALVKEEALLHFDFPNAFLMDEAVCFIKPVSKALSNFQPKAPPSRLPECYGGCVDVLNKFARRTYAPSSEQSRSTGAGSNLIDDD
jgi:hypothetical protein